jgi:hypothetical protein
MKRQTLRSNSGCLSEIGTATFTHSLDLGLVIASPNGKRKHASKHDSLLKGYPSGTELAFEDSWQGHGSLWAVYEAFEA